MTNIDKDLNVVAREVLKFTGKNTNDLETLMNVTTYLDLNGKEDHKLTIYEAVEVIKKIATILLN